MTSHKLDHIIAVSYHFPSVMGQQDFERRGEDDASANRSQRVPADACLCLGVPWRTVSVPEDLTTWKFLFHPVLNSMGDEGDIRLYIKR